MILTRDIAVKFAAALVLFAAATASAQQLPVNPGASAPAQTQEIPPTAPAPRLPDEVDPSEVPSLLFTFWEHESLMDARNSIGVVRAPTQAEIDDDRPLSEPKQKPPPEMRYITLGGIVFAGDKDWTIWLNGQRVEPKAVPPEVIDLKVYKDYVDIKWFDDYTNQIYPIRLRPHQRFNIDTRIFLPG
ncbi:MAG: hypothetical protein L6Q57_05675 [Alphaproteobacteria bacterium]|nr:hypothetical protein [Alphaproteobacteria bacterium]